MHWDSLHRQRLFLFKTVNLHELPERTNSLKYLCGALFELPLQNIPDQSLMRFHDGENEAVCKQQTARQPGFGAELKSQGK